MNILTTIKRIFASALDGYGEKWLATPPHSGAGMPVNDGTALNHATVWACVRIISETVATLGWHVTKGVPGGDRERDYGPVDWLLNTQSNDEMSAFSWRELALMQTLLSGNHFSEIVRDVSGRPLALWPLDPYNTYAERDEGGALGYRTFNERGSVFLRPRDVFHLHGLSGNGISGLSVLTVARRSIGSGLALDEFGASFYKNGTQLGIVLEHPKTLSDGARERLKKDIQDRTGSGNAFRALVAEEGLKLQRTNMTMIDAQFLESRKFQVSEICRWFRVPPHKVADLEKATFSNIEHQAIEFVQDTILPWCKRLEQEADLKLFGVARQGIMRTRLNVDTLLRGDAKSRFEAYGLGRQWGYLSVNDIRHLENMNGIGPEGDRYLEPANMVEAGAAGAEAVPDAPAPADPNPENSDQPTNRAATVVDLLSARARERRAMS